MNLTVKALQLGPTDFSKTFRLSSSVRYFYEPVLREPTDAELSALSGEAGRDAEAEYDFALIDRPLSWDEALFLNRHVRAHCLFNLAGSEEERPNSWLLLCRDGYVIHANQLESLLLKNLPDFFSASYGEKLKPETFAVSDRFGGTIRWNGYSGPELSGDFGEEFTQIGYWRMNIPIEENQTLDFWVEFETEGSVEIELELTEFLAGSVDRIEDRRVYRMEEMRKLFRFTNTKRKGSLFFSLNAKGNGTLRIIALHDRYSRRGKGSFLIGGRRRVTSKREEMFFYFDPGDRRPPFNVYFSGYKTREGFEGYHMLRSFGAPFLLVSEPRLEGGDFYIGTEEYREKLTDTILEYMKELGFGPKEMIFSGLSMGTTGALYYGSRIRPGHILLGKPLIHLGSIASRERIERPGGFPTSLDVLKKEEGSLSPEASDHLDQEFVSAVRETDWSQTKFAVSYMYEDDYDGDAYRELLSGLTEKGVRIIGKGLHGRHNDDTPGIVGWFLERFREILREDFYRGDLL